MKKLKKISLKNVSPLLSDVEMKSMVGGNGGSGTPDDPYRLDEVVIYGYYNPCATTNVFGCCECPRWDTGPGADGTTAGDAARFGYRVGVVINHLIYH